jgi:hypothetical protein
MTDDIHSLRERMARAVAALESCAADLLLIMRHDAGLHPDVMQVAQTAHANAKRALLELNDARA